MSTKGRIEYLRQELRAERISYGELAELDSLKAHIDPSDLEMLEAAGVPEGKTKEINLPLAYGGEFEPDNMPQSVTLHFTPEVLQHVERLQRTIQSEKDEHNLWMDIHLDIDYELFNEDFYPRFDKLIITSDHLRWTCNEKYSDIEVFSNSFTLDDLS